MIRDVKSADFPKEDGAFNKSIQFLLMATVPVLCTSTMPNGRTRLIKFSTTSGESWISISKCLLETCMILAPMTLQISIKDERFVAL